MEREPGTGMRRGSDIANRLVGLGANVVALAKGMPRDSIGRHIAMQVLRSGTSAGANYEEARGAESRADFIHKVRIAVKELRETIYWLRLVRRSALVTSNLDAMIDEADQITAILIASAKTARESSA